MITSVVCWCGDVDVDVDVDVAVDVDVSLVDVDVAAAAAALISDPRLIFRFTTRCVDDMSMRRRTSGRVDVAVEMEVTCDGSCTAGRLERRESVELAGACA